MNYTTSAQRKSNIKEIFVRDMGSNQNKSYSIDKNHIKEVELWVVTNEGNVLVKKNEKTNESYSQDNVAIHADNIETALQILEDRLGVILLNDNQPEYILTCKHIEEKNIYETDMYVLFFDTNTKCSELLSDSYEVECYNYEEIAQRMENLDRKFYKLRASTHLMIDYLRNKFDAE